MRDQVRSGTSPRRITRTALTVALAAVGLAGIYSCSLLVEGRSQQCQADADCTNAGFAGARCDPTNGVCVRGTGGSGSASSGSSTGSTSSSSSTTTTSSGTTTTTTTGCDENGGIDAGGCYNCPPSTDPQFLNACTTGCIAFDNARVTLLDGGVLPPLNDAGPNDAGM